MKYSMHAMRWILNYTFDLDHRVSCLTKLLPVLESGQAGQTQLSRVCSRLHATDKHAILMIRMRILHALHSAITKTSE